MESLSAKVAEETKLVGDEPKNVESRLNPNASDFVPRGATASSAASQPFAQSAAPASANTYQVTASSMPSGALSSIAGNRIPVIYQQGPNSRYRANPAYSESSFCFVTNDFYSFLVKRRFAPLELYRH